MSDQHVTKSDLRDVITSLERIESKMEGKIDGFMQSINNRLDKISDSFADKESVMALHQKYWAVNDKIVEVEKKQIRTDTRLATWITVGAAVWAIVVVAISQVISRFA